MKDEKEINKRYGGELSMLASTKNGEPSIDILEDAVVR